MFFFFFKQKTAYEMRISDWSSDVCSSDLLQRRRHLWRAPRARHRPRRRLDAAPDDHGPDPEDQRQLRPGTLECGHGQAPDRRSEEHTSELQSLMRISYAVFCLKKKK